MSRKSNLPFFEITSSTNQESLITAKGKILLEELNESKNNANNMNIPTLPDSTFITVTSELSDMDILDSSIALNNTQPDSLSLNDADGAVLRNMISEYTQDMNNSMSLVNNKVEDNISSEDSSGNAGGESFMYLDSNTGLHILVHNVPSDIENIQVQEDESNTPFMVVAPLGSPLNFDKKEVNNTNLDSKIFIDPGDLMSCSINNIESLNNKENLQIILENSILMNNEDNNITDNNFVLQLQSESKEDPSTSDIMNLVDSTKHTLTDSLFPEGTSLMQDLKYKSFSLDHLIGSTRERHNENVASPATVIDLKSLNNISCDTKTSEPSIDKNNSIKFNVEELFLENDEPPTVITMDTINEGVTVDVDIEKDNIPKILEVSIDDIEDCRKIKNVKETALNLNTQGANNVRITKFERNTPKSKCSEQLKNILVTSVTKEKTTKSMKSRRKKPCFRVVPSDSLQKQKQPRKNSSKVAFSSSSKRQKHTNTINEENSHCKDKQDIHPSITNTTVEDSEEDNSIYDIVVTFRCKLCSRVFVKKETLIQHYNEVHKKDGVVRININTTDVEQEENVGKKRHVSESSMPSIEMMEVKKFTCRLCGVDFFDKQEHKEHLTKIHPSATLEDLNVKKRKQSSQNEPTYPVQTGTLIGQRKTSTKEGQTALGKRQVKESKDLRNNYVLEVQKEEPIYLKKPEKNFDCSRKSCIYKFSTQENLKIHESCHYPTGDKKSFQCNECLENFEKWVLCQKHLWKKHKIDVDMLTCGICTTYKASQPFILSVHQQTHFEKQHECQVCGKKFHQHAQLINHEVTHKDYKDRPQWAQKKLCNICNKWLSDAQALKSHIKEVHVRLKYYGCQFCDYKSTKKSSVQLHKRQHTGVLPLVCELCDFCTKDHNSLRRHQKRHVFSSNLICPLCSYSTNQLSSFKHHHVKKHFRQLCSFKCPECNIKLQDIQDFLTHYKKHEKEIFKNVIECRKNARKEVRMNNRPVVLPTKLVAKPKDGGKLNIKRDRTSHNLDNVKNELLVDSTCAKQRPLLSNIENVSPDKLRPVIINTSNFNNDKQTSIEAINTGDDVPPTVITVQLGESKVIAREDPSCLINDIKNNIVLTSNELGDNFSIDTNCRRIEHSNVLLNKGVQHVIFNESDQQFFVNISNPDVIEC